MIIRLFLPYLLSAAFLVAVLPALDADWIQVDELRADGAISLTATIQSVLVEDSQWELVVAADSEHFAGRALRARVRTGDLAVYAAGASVHAKLARKGKQLELMLVWPHASNGRGIVQSVNHQLRMDTEGRGHYPFRALGEYLPPFALYNQQGKVTQSSHLKGSYVVINFIFTRCMVARMCPLSTQKMRTLRSLLEKDFDDSVRLVSISLDPEYDTPGVLHEYATAYEFPTQGIDFLSGPARAVHDLKAQLGVLAKADDKLIINHTMMVVVADPLGKIIYQVPGSGWSPEAVLNHINQQQAALSHE